MNTFRILITATALAFSQPVLAQNVTVTGSNGGSVQSSRDCTRVAGVATCSKSATATTASGKTATRNRVRVTEQGSSSMSASATGPNGQTKTRNRELTITR
jgi:hypothetical protein